MTQDPMVPSGFGFGEFDWYSTIICNKRETKTLIASNLIWYKRLHDYFYMKSQ
jgi:hypothetical protein